MVVSWIFIYFGILKFNCMYTVFFISDVWPLQQLLVMSKILFYTLSSGIASNEESNPSFNSSYSKWFWKI